MMADPFRVLILDIETAPHLVYVWRLFQTDVGANQMLKHASIMCWSAKWLGKKRLYYESAQYSSEKVMLSKLLPLLNEADAVVGHNLSRFDAARIRGQCLVHGLPLPAPYKEIDTLTIARKEFAFGSNSLRYLADVLGCAPKSEHTEFPGFELWAECLKGNSKAWQAMKQYNLQDIRSTEELYLKIRPYARQHSNWGVFAEEGRIVCPKCGSANSQRRGFARTGVGKFQRFQCMDCGGWHRTRFSEYPKEKRRALAVNLMD